MILSICIFLFDKLLFLVEREKKQAMRPTKKGVLKGFDCCPFSFCMRHMYTIPLFVSLPSLTSISSSLQTHCFFSRLILYSRSSSFLSSGSSIFLSLPQHFLLVLPCSSLISVLCPSLPFSLPFLLPPFLLGLPRALS